MALDNNEQLLKKAKNGDRLARDELVLLNLGLVRKIALRFSHAEYEDIVQIGSIGLLKAIDNFDASFGVRFSTYAVPMIIGEIKRFLRDDGIIKVSRTYKERAKKGNRAREELIKMLDREPTISEISEFSGVPKEELLEAFDATRTPDSIDRCVSQTEDATLGDFLPSSCDEDKIIDRLTLEAVLSGVSARERQILVMRHLKGKTQREIADIIGVSQVQVSRIEKNTIEKIRKTQLV